MFASKYSGSQRREETGREAKADPLLFWALTPARSNPIQRPRKKPSKRKTKKRQGEPKPETNTKKQRAKQTRASPSQPTKQQQQQAAASPRARATPPREQPARPPVSSEGNSSSAGPRPAPARQPQLLPSRRSAQFLLFLGFDSVPPGASSPSPEIQQVRARRSSARPGIMPPLL